MEKTMKKFIECTKGAREHLALLFGVTDKTVYRALMYEGVDTDIRRKIRKVALDELGGVKMLTLPECETIHDADGYMRQYFGNGWLIEVDKKSGLAVVYDKRGDVKAKQACCTIAELCGLQEIVEAAD